MWFFKDIILVVGCVIMIAISIMGFIGLGFDIKEIDNNIGSWHLTWFGLGFIILVIAFWVVVIKLIVRLNKYEKAKPVLSTREMSFPMSGTRIIRVIEDGRHPSPPEAGYAKIAVRNTGGLLEDCIGTVTGIAKISVLKGQLQITRLRFTSAQLFWDDGNSSNNIPNDGIDRYLNLAYLDQNEPDSWQLAISRKEDYFSGWHKISVVISSLRTEIKPLVVEVALGFGRREDPPSPLNLWPWDKWHKSILREIEQAPDKEGFQIE